MTQRQKIGQFWIVFESLLLEWLIDWTEATTSELQDLCGHTICRFGTQSSNNNMETTKGLEKLDLMKLPARPSFFAYWFFSSDFDFDPTQQRLAERQRQAYCSGASKQPKYILTRINLALMCQKLRSVAFDWAWIWGLAAFILSEAAHSHTRLVISSLCPTLSNITNEKRTNTNWELCRISAFEGKCSPAAAAAAAYNCAS